MTFSDNSPPTPVERSKTNKALELIVEHLQEVDSSIAVSLSFSKRGQLPQPNQTYIDQVSPLQVYRIQRDTPLFRIHKHKDPIFFSPFVNRFKDPHIPKGNKQVGIGQYGVLYVALAAHIAICETCQPDDSNLLRPQYLKDNKLSILYPTRDLVLVDLSGSGLLQLHADAQITTITFDDYQLSNAWSRALYQHPEKVDGIYYRSRRDPSGFCLALYSGRLSTNDFRVEALTPNSLQDPEFRDTLQKVKNDYMLLEEEESRIPYRERNT